MTDKFLSIQIRFLIKYSDFQTQTGFNADMNANMLAEMAVRQNTIITFIGT
jgi:hypothetical protein